MPFEFPGFNPFRGNPFGQAGQDYQAPSPFERNYFQQDEENNPFAGMNNPFMRSPEPPEPPPQEEYQEGPLMSQYKGLVNQPAPQREEFAHPGKMARIGAMLSAIGDRSGFQGARDILDRPYNQAVLDRERGVRELERGAKLEQEAGQEAWRRDKETQALAQGKRKLDIDEKNKQSLDERRDAMTNLGWWKAQNPGFDKMEVRGGVVGGFNKADGTFKPATDADGNQISSGLMSQKDLAELNQKNDLAKIAANVAGRKEVVGIQQAGEDRRANLRATTSIQLGDMVRDRQLSVEEAKLRSREKIIDMLQDNPDYHPIMTKGGSWQLYDKKSGKTIDTGIDTGTLTEDDAIMKRLGGGTTTVTSLNPEGTQRTTKTTRTPAPTSPTRTPSTPTNPTTPRASAPARTTTPANPTQMTDPDGKVHDTSKWTERDFQQARLRKWQ